MPTDERLTLALPIDTVRLFDTSVSQAQLDASTFQNSTDDIDLLAGMIEDAENEFRQHTGEKYSIGRKGITGRRETYEQVTYDVSGHEQYKRAWTGTAGNYRNTERTKQLDGERVLPFDPDEGDEAYVYRGLSPGVSDSWEDITAEYGETWAIRNHVTGRIAISPVEIARSLRGNYHGLGVGRDRLRNVTLAISYRYGGLGGSSNHASATTLTETGGIDDSQTDTVDVADGARFPSDGTKIVLIDREYLEVKALPDTDELQLIDRGVRGTDAASHEDGARIQYTPPAVRKAVAARAAEQLVVSGRYTDWMPDTEDSVDRDDMIDQFSEIWDGTVTALSG